MMEVNGLTIHINRKNIKNLHLSVMPSNGWVRVSSPMGVDDETIRLFVLSKFSWILEKQKEFTNQLRESKREYVSGESHYLFGNRYLLLVQESDKYAVITKGKHIIFRVKTKSSLSQKKYHFSEWRKKLLGEKIKFFIEKWGKILNVSPENWKIQKMLTKWGSCNFEKKTILFNLELSKKPNECIEYVVVHEMCHLIYKTHSQDFRKKLSQALPFWEETQKLLNSLHLNCYE